MPSIEAADPDHIDELLARLMEQPEDNWQTTLERICAEHPDAAEAVRRRFALLERVGLVASRVPATIEPGATLGEFVLGDLIGGGAMGCVYHARLPGSDEAYAVKVLRPELSLRSSSRTRFAREARIASELDHPNLCRVLAHGGENVGRPWLAMPLVDGESLASRMRNNRSKLCEDERKVRLVVERIRAIATGLHCLHAKGLVHRDVKPANIMLRTDGSPVLVDFGLTWEPDAATLTISGDVVGTPAYMAPEQVRGDDTVTAATDVHALGACLFECLAQRPPFVAGDRETLYRAILTEEAPSLRQWNRWIPAPLERVVARCLEKASKQRYANAGELADDLQRFLDGRAVLARRPTVLRRGWRLVRRRPLATLSAAVGVLLVATITLLWLASHERERAYGALAAGQSRALASFNPFSATLLARHAHRTEPNVATRSQLMASLATMRQVGEVQLTGWVGAALPSPDDKVLLCTQITGFGTFPQRFAPGEFHGPWATVIAERAHTGAWSPDGGRYAVAGGGSKLGTPRHRNLLRICDRDGETLFEQAGIGVFNSGRLHEAHSLVQFTADNHVVVGCDDGKVRVVAPSCDAVSQWQAFENGAAVAAVHLTGTRILAISSQNRVVIADLDGSNKRQLCPAIPNATTRHSAIVAEGRELLVSGSKGLWRLDLEASDGRRALISTKDVFEATAAFSSSGRAGILHTDVFRTVVWQRPDGQRKPLRFPTPISGFATAMACSQNGERFAAAYGLDAQIVVFDEWGRVVCQLDGHGSQIRWLRFSRDSRFLLSASEDGTVRRWQLQLPKFPLLGQRKRSARKLVEIDSRHAVALSHHQLLALRDGELQQYPEIGTGNRAIAICRTEHALVAPGHTLIAIASPLHDVKLFDFAPDASKDELLTPITFEHGRQWAAAIAFQRDGELLAAHRSDGSVSCFDQEMNLRWRTPEADNHRSAATGLALAPDGRIASIGLDGTVRIRDRDGQRIGEPQAFLSELTAIDWSPDGSTLVVGSSRGALWQVDVARRERTPLPGHEGRIESVAFSPDGGRLLTGSSDGSVRLWQLPDFRLLLDLQPTGVRDLRAVSWRLDGSGFYTTHAERQARLWPVDDDLDGMLERLAAQALYRSFTPRERLRHRGVLGR